ncbi:MAG: tetratricopeptide repeat protein, partial [Brevinematia bacterium]
MELSKESTVRLLSYYKKGLSFYRNRDFTTAIQYFSECLRINPEDGPSKVYLERCKEYLQNPPPPDWDG